MLPPEYITGLTEGEGSFTYSYTKQTNALGLYLALALNIKDLPLLKQVQEYFKGGTIYFVKAEAGKFKNPKSISGARAYYRITRLGELLRVVAHFDKYPLHGHKAKAYEIWKKMVHLKRYMYRFDMPKILELAQELSQVNGPGGKGKLPQNREDEVVPQDPIYYSQADLDAPHLETSA